MMNFDKGINASKTQDMDKANVVIPPPVAWALAIALGLALDWFLPLPYIPAAVSRIWVGAAIFGAGFALSLWAILTFRKAGTRIEPHKPTTAIVAVGPYRFTRNPMYSGMLLGQIGFSIGFNSLWQLAALVPFYLVLRHGVIAREEAYLERKFGAGYLGYKSGVRRWL
ncbi:MAG: hypothetical protein FD175_753 [Beijerinckiaceae bacterium]|nr:MAG: hypothetical protein FD175_753 [Beijerinckiaceae bacterium]